MITVTDTSILDKYDRKRKDDYQKEVQQDVEQPEAQKSAIVSEDKTEPITQATPAPATEQKPKTRADIVQDLGINPQRDTKRMRSLQQAGKVQAYTNALILLAQAAGGFAGATVPKIDWKNSAGEELSNLQKMYDEEDSWSRRQMLLDKIQDLNRKDQQGFETELMKERFGHDENMFTKREKLQRDLHEDQQEFQRTEADKDVERDKTKQINATDEYIRRVVTPAKVRDEELYGIKGQRNVATGKWTPIDGMPNANGAGGTSRLNKNGVFYQFFEPGSNTPVTAVKTKDQALGILRKIVSDAKGDTQLATALSSLVDPEKPAGEYTDQEIQVVLDAFWQDYAPELDESIRIDPVLERETNDYITSNWNNADRGGLFNHVNQANSAEDIANYMQEADKNLKPEDAQKYAKQLWNRRIVGEQKLVEQEDKRLKVYRENLQKILANDPQFEEASERVAKYAIETRREKDPQAYVERYFTDMLRNYDVSPEFIKEYSADLVNAYAPPQQVAKPE